MAAVAVALSPMLQAAPPGTPKSGEYALGWLIVTQPWANAPCLTHDGSNTMNLARAAFWPSKDFGFVIMTNIGGQNADAAFNQLAPELYKRFVK